MQDSSDKQRVTFPGPCLGGQRFRWVRYTPAVLWPRRAPTLEHRGDLSGPGRTHAVRVGVEQPCVWQQNWPGQWKCESHLNLLLSMGPSLSGPGELAACPEDLAGRAFQTSSPVL